jgi:hypothetical protein
MIVLLAKLSGADSPTAISEWGIHYQRELEALLQIKLKRGSLVVCVVAPKYGGYNW